MPVKVDKSKCEGIGACVQACPTNAIELQEDGSGELRSVVARPEDCVECGICIDACPTESISIE
ncbi:4Fe-4S dicluster domain-containing protein [Methanolobus chelungpuianus]|uniref:4Fe-4S ferredoxin n=1 Tax=Methanolobus chelungpuianus TaxID=502115 RepID=A0AAE3H9Q4_9EURY|nr:4Fe-4S ferredoxin [Methanolobus chelungpuianus]